MATEKWIPNEAQRTVLETLKAEAAGNASEFARDFTIYSESKWSKIMAALDTDDKRRSYFDEIKEPLALMSDLEELLERLPQMRLERDRRNARKLLPISAHQAAAKAVRYCKGKTSPERLIKVIGPTGAGKTHMRHFLEKEFAKELPVAAVEARESWRPAHPKFRPRCKLVALRDIARALGIATPDEALQLGRLDDLEDEIIRHCTEHRRLLFIDEAEFFSGFTLNLIKLLLNATRVVVVLACTPRAHAKWHDWFPDEAEQIDRRTDSVISLADVSPNDAALFFAPKQFEDAPKSLEAIAGAARQFGHLSLVNRISELLGNSNQADRAQVEAAIAKAQRQMARAVVRAN